MTFLLRNRESNEMGDKSSSNRCACGERTVLMEPVLHEDSIVSEAPLRDDDTTLAMTPLPSWTLSFW
jgi:hypothetical protein